MKKIKSIILILLIFMISGCNILKKEKYSFFEDERNILSVSIYEKKDDINDIFLCEIVDKDSFLEDFKSIEFDYFIFGDPTHISDGSKYIRVDYESRTIEKISYYAQSIIKGDETLFGRRYCNEKQFIEFISKYISE